jgi:hypothetical protein
MTDLEQQFRADMMAGIDTAKREFGYVPTYFLRMVAEHGPIATCKILLAAPEVQEGFTKLWECKRLDLTMEALVCDPKYSALFTSKERATARRRLAKLGYDVRRRAE